jgi:nitroreductase
MEFSQLIEKRYSVRAYKPDQVEDSKLRQALEAARLMTPTAANRLPFQLVLMVITEKIDRIFQLASNAQYIKP